MTTSNTTIGSRLLTERKRLGLKQSDITAKLGIGRTTLHRYENNESTPSIKAINGLTSLGFNMQYVLNDDTALEDLITPQELELIKLFRQAQPIITSLNVWAFNERAQHYLLHLPVISPSSRMVAFLRCLLQVSPDTNTKPLLVENGLQTANTCHPSSLAYPLCPQCHSHEVSELAETIPSVKPQSEHLAAPLSTAEKPPQPLSQSQSHYEEI